MSKGIYTMNIVKRILPIMILLALVACLTAAPATVDADDQGAERFTAVVKYYDDVQITYTINYPNGGIWSGSGDIPLGGIAGGISSQIYCVDPFIHFHNVAATSWPAPDYATTDTMGDYVVAAPWSVNTAMHYQTAPVEWLTLNGYRGDYRAHDRVSRESIQRLRALYPGVFSGLSDTDAKRIGLMGTKVAVWKVLAGDQVIISKTSLNAALQSRLDSLITAMVADAKADRPVPGARKTIASEILLTTVNAEAADLHTTGTGKAYYGPLQLQVAVSDYSAGDPGALGKAFLTATGPDSGNVRFVTFNSGAATTDYSTPETAPLLTDGLIYGTGAPGQYFTGALSGDTWTSPVFYMEVPEGRNGLPLAASADDLTIHTMAKVEDAALVEGTPLTFTWADPASGVQSWNHVQAYIGAANDGFKADLYACDVLPLGQTALGYIQIHKQVENTTADDGLQEYYFEVYYSPNAAGPFSTKVQLDKNNTLSVCSVDESLDRFDIRNGGIATIRDLPEGYYQVVEIDTGGTQIASVDFQVDDDLGNLSARAPAVQSGNQWVADPVHLVQTAPSLYQMEPRDVVFINTKLKPSVRLYVTKWALETSNLLKIHDRGTPYAFQIEHSTDNGATWQPMDLTGANFGGTDIALDNAANGTFSVRTMGMCYIDLNTTAVGELYRLTELNADSDFAPSYLHSIYDGANAQIAESYVAGTAGAVTYTTGAMPALDQTTQYIVFMNTKSLTSALSIEKRVAGNAVTDTDRETLFPFQITYMGGLTNLTSPAIAPLTTDPLNASAAALVTGIPADRLTHIGQDGYPTVLWLKDGETATLEGIFFAQYRVIEYPKDTSPDPKFAIFYDVWIEGTASPVASGEDQATGVIDINGVETRTVTFTNTVGNTPIHPNKPDAPGGEERHDAPWTGDTTRPVLWIILAAFSAAVLLGLCVFKFKRRQNRHKD